MVYKTEGVCCQEIRLEVANGIITELEFLNGCNGNLKGISELSKGRKPEDVIDVLSGILCKGRGTSCPDQLAKALKNFK